MQTLGTTLSVSPNHNARVAQRGTRRVLIATVFVFASGCFDDDPSYPNGDYYEPPVDGDGDGDEICDLEECESIPRLRFSLPDKPIAVGGTVSVRAKDCPFFCSDFDADFDVVVGTGLEVLAVNPPVIEVRVLQQGANVMRLYRPQDSALFGEGAIRADAVDHIEANTATYASGVEHEVHFALRSASGEELIDQSLTVDVGDALGEQINRCRFGIGPAPAGIHEVIIGVGTLYETALPMAFADGPDAIERDRIYDLVSGEDLDFDAPVLPLESVLLATWRSIYNGGPFYGAEWTAGDFTGVSRGDHGSVFFLAEEIGLVDLSISTGELTDTITVEVVEND